MIPKIKLLLNYYDSKNKKNLTKVAAWILYGGEET